MISKALVIKELIRYGAYVALGLLVVIILGVFGSSDGSEQVAEAVHCRPSGQTPTVEELNKKLLGKGVFEGKADAFIEAGKRHGVDPVLVAAIAFHETGMGTSHMVRTKNNPGGLYANGGFMEFPTLDDGIDKMTENLAKNYIRQGLKTPEQIGPKYAPVPDENDPNGLNRHWIPNVIRYVNQLGGLSYDCSPVDLENLGPVSASGFLRPIPTNFRITSKFGPRWGRIHTGLDFACQGGVTPIVASKSGRVAASLFGTPGSGFFGYGEVVLVDHGGGVQTLYAHMTQRNVNVGDQVAQGQQLGICGSTGNSTGPHLHFEVRINGGRFDPLPFLEH
ncbi:M23 family metallopeptidase [Staphylospora marina]|uniref:M23 family metallopeptidase n=1 Tax=Staphylospora marina TaxID=2490858 RepID=UPI001F14FA84|nr:peptidoglycan DD-metalloendopeptidase family protein [Staphylospora marina]